MAKSKSRGSHHSHSTGQVEYQPLGQRMQNHLLAFVQLFTLANLQMLVQAVVTEVRTFLSNTDFRGIYQRTSARLHAWCLYVFRTAFVVYNQPWKLRALHFASLLGSMITWMLVQVLKSTLLVVRLTDEEEKPFTPEDFANFLFSTMETLERDSEKQGQAAGPAPPMWQSANDAIRAISQFTQHESDEGYVPDYYAMLCVRRYADATEIKRAYRKLSLLIHPDKTQVQGAEKAFSALSVAYQVLTDQEARQQYDRQLRTSMSMANLHETLANSQDWIKLKERITKTMQTTIECPRCGGRHPKRKTEKEVAKARWCEACSVYHPAKEGDMWAERSLGGIRWHCFLAFPDAVYEITEWGTCNGLHHALVVGAHKIMCRLDVRLFDQSSSTHPDHHDGDDDGHRRTHTPRRTPKTKAK